MRKRIQIVVIGKNLILLTKVGFRTLKEKRTKDEAILEVIMAILLCSEPLSLSALLGLMSPKTSEKSSRSSSAYLSISISDCDRCILRDEVDETDRCRALLVLASLVDFGAVFRSLGWNSFGENVSAGDGTSKDSLGNMEGGLAICMAFSFSSNALSSATVRSE